MGWLSVEIQIYLVIALGMFVVMLPFLVVLHFGRPRDVTNKRQPGDIFDRDH